MIPKSYVVIVDRESLAEVLRTEIQRRGLTQKQTADIVGVAQGTISKLLRRRRPSLHRTDVYRIAEFLPSHERPRLERALLGAEAREILKAHRAWLDESLKPYSEPPPHPDPGYEPEVIRRVPRPPWRPNVRWYDVFSACHLLRSDHEAGQEIRRFEHAAAKLGFTADADDLTADRFLLAFIRVFDPIAGGQGRVERPYEELQHTGELQKYLKAAFDRELVLLHRASDLRRAQEWGSALREVRPRFIKIEA